jgi:hypothetical protein
MVWTPLKKTPFLTMSCSHGQLCCCAHTRTHASTHARPSEDAELCPHEGFLVFNTFERRLHAARNPLKSAQNSVRLCEPIRPANNCWTSIFLSGVFRLYRPCP